MKLLTEGVFQVSLQMVTMPDVLQSPSEHQSVPGIIYGLIRVDPLHPSHRAETTAEERVARFTDERGSIQSLRDRAVRNAGSLDPANPKTPAAKATALTRSLWAEYMSDRTAIASEGQRAYLGILNRYSMGRP